MRRLEFSEADLVQVGGVKCIALTKLLDICEKRGKMISEVIETPGLEQGKTENARGAKAEIKSLIKACQDRQAGEEEVGLVY